MKKFLLMISLTTLIAFSANPSARAMTEHQKDVCDTWIHGSAVAAAGTAAVSAQIPLTDIPALIGILGTLTVRLAAVFDLNLDMASAKKIAYAVWEDSKAMVYARGASEILLGWIPGWGNSVNAATAAGVVEYVGWKIADAFDTGVSNGKIISNFLDGALKENPKSK